MDKMKRIENQFAYTLNRLMKSMIGTFSANVKYYDPKKFLEWLEIYANSPAYKDWCERVAYEITSKVDRNVSATWREAARKAGRGNDIYAAIMAELEKPHGGVFSQTVRENAKMITNKIVDKIAKKIESFPLEMREEMVQYISHEGLQGRRSSDIMSDLLERFRSIGESRLQLIARTEVSKSQSALTQSRALSLGLNWYIWRTSDDARVRTAHEHMDSVLVNWNNPPNPEALDPKGKQKPYGNYHAGGTFNCRCYSEVIVNLNYVEFPAKVYRNNAIVRMTRADFEKLM